MVPIKREKDAFPSEDAQMAIKREVFREEDALLLAQVEHPAAAAFFPVESVDAQTQTKRKGKAAEKAVKFEYENGELSEYGAVRLLISIVSMNMDDERLRKVSEGKVYQEALRAMKNEQESFVFNFYRLLDVVCSRDERLARLLPEVFRHLPSRFHRHLRGNFLFMLAVWGGKSDVAQVLMHCGYQADCVDPFGCSPLHYAMEKDDLPLFKVI